MNTTAAPRPITPPRIKEHLQQLMTRVKKLMRDVEEGPDDDFLISLFKPAAVQFKDLDATEFHSLYADRTHVIYADASASDNPSRPSFLGMPKFDSQFVDHQKEVFGPLFHRPLVPRLRDQRSGILTAPSKIAFQEHLKRLQSTVDSVGKQSIRDVISSLDGLFELDLDWLVFPKTKYVHLKVALNKAKVVGLLTPSGGGKSFAIKHLGLLDEVNTCPSDLEVVFLWDMAEKLDSSSILQFLQDYEGLGDLKRRIYCVNAAFLVLYLSTVMLFDSTPESFLRLQLSNGQAKCADIAFKLYKELDTVTDIRAAIDFLEEVRLKLVPNQKNPLNVIDEVPLLTEFGSDVVTIQSTIGDKVETIPSNCLTEVLRSFVTLRSTSMLCGTYFSVPRILKSISNSLKEGSQPPFALVTVDPPSEADVKGFLHGYLNIHGVPSKIQQALEHLLQGNSRVLKAFLSALYVSCSLDPYPVASASANSSSADKTAWKVKLLRSAMQLVVDAKMEQAEIHLRDMVSAPDNTSNNLKRLVLSEILLSERIEYNKEIDSQDHSINEMLKALKKYDESLNDLSWTDDIIRMLVSHGLAFFF